MLLKKDMQRYFMKEEALLCERKKIIFAMIIYISVKKPDVDS